MAEGQNPSEQRGGTTPDEAEAREKGEWAGQAGEGVVVGVLDALIKDFTSKLGQI